jgi:hypothetical protein
MNLTSVSADHPDKMLTQSELNKKPCIRITVTVFYSGCVHTWRHQAKSFFIDTILKYVY